MNLLILLVATGLVPAAVGTSAAHENGSASEHNHSMRAVPPGEAVPTISLAVISDSVSGYNVEVTTANFRFSPESTGLATDAVEGHAHLYVDGVKKTRVYGAWVHVPREWLGSGENLLRVTLNDNRHADWTVDGRPIAAELSLMGPDAWIGRSLELHLEDEATAPTLTVTKGEKVRLLVHTDREQELHLHGYDLVALATPSTPAVIEFTAGHSGRFPLVTHSAENLLGRDEAPRAYVEVRTP